MKFEEIRNIVKSKKNGTFMSMTYEKDVPVKSAYKGTVIYRKTTIVVRCGVEYDNISAVKDKRNNGQLPHENEGLPWGRWKEYPYFIEHNGKVYLRCATVNGNKAKSSYYMNGNAIEKEKLDGIIRKESGGNTDIMTINIDNIVSVA